MQPVGSLRCGPSMPTVRVDLPGEAIVIRFRPTTPDSVLRSAEKEARRTGGRFGLSVFAAVARAGETSQEVISRLLKASELGGIDSESNPKYFVCTRTEELLSRGFTFCKDGDDDEVAEHYTVDLGPQPSLEDVNRFLEVFVPGLRG
jgi:hypothetical protein